MIRVKRPEKYSAAWQIEVEDYIDANRDAIYADCAQVIARASQMPWAGATRWARWEAGVLVGCCADAGEMRRVMDLVKARQAEDDGDEEATETLGERIRAEVQRTAADKTADENGVVALDKPTLAQIVKSVVGKMGRDVDGDYLGALGLHRGSLPQLVRTKSGGTRWFWVGDGHPEARRLRLTGDKAPKPRDLEDAAEEYARSRPRQKGPDVGPASSSWFGVPTVNQ